MFAIITLSLLERAINGALKTDVISQQNIARLLNDKCLRVVLDSPQLSVDVFFDAPSSTNTKIRISPTLFKPSQINRHSLFKQPPYASHLVLTPADCTLHTSNAVTLINLLTQKNIGNVPISGDMKVLQHLSTILANMQIDLIKKLQPIIGKGLTSQLSQRLHTFQTQLKTSTQQLGFYGQEWLKEDNPLLAKRWQMQQHKADVRDLRVQIERLNARLDKLIHS